jgi:hypothetical protein
MRPVANSDATLASADFCLTALRLRQYNEQRRSWNRVKQALVSPSASAIFGAPARCSPSAGAAACTARDVNYEPVVAPLRSSAGTPRHAAVVANGYG